MWRAGGEHRKGSKRSACNTVPPQQKCTPPNEVGACHFFLMSAPLVFFQLGMSPLKPSLLDQLGIDTTPKKNPARNFCWDYTDIADKFVEYCD